MHDFSLRTRKGCGTVSRHNELAILSAAGSLVSA
jgi:hypothetical protein